MVAQTPPPPYYAVIFTSSLAGDHKDYHEMSEKMLDLVKDQEGFLGYETARNTIGITISYWRSKEAIRKWKHHVDHKVARQLGRDKFYSFFKVRICKVERDYDFLNMAP